MVQSQEQVDEVVEQLEVEIVELSEADLKWIGGGTGIVTTEY